MISSCLGLIIIDITKTDIIIKKNDILKIANVNSFEKLEREIDRIIFFVVDLFSCIIIFFLNYYYDCKKFYFCKILFVLKN